MKRLLYLFPLLTLVACKSSEIVHITPADGSTRVNDTSAYRYENDTLRVTYDFWAPRGRMRFSIENKTSIPIYIDWAKSSMIRGNDKINYYEDQVYTKSRSSAVAGRGIFNTAIAVGSSEGVSTKRERITFMPPHSSIVAYYGKLATFDFITLDQKNSRPIPYGIFEQQAPASLNTGPLFYRNFLTYAASDKFEHEQYVDNSFRADTIYHCKASHYPTLQKHYKSPGSYFLNQ